MELLLRQSCTSLQAQSVESRDPQLSRAIRNLRVLSRAQIELQTIMYPPEEGFEDLVAYIRIDGVPDVLWRDWSDPREGIFWLENAGISGKIVEIARALRSEKPEEASDDNF